jgi:creatine kinase
MFLQSVKNIEKDLGIAKKNCGCGVDAVGNFPLITDKHRSLTCKALKADPSLYAKYANVKTPMGFTFDQAIQAGLDAPHLGVGIVAGEAAAYKCYKDIMDVVLEGWHGYKPTDNHK